MKKITFTHLVLLLIFGLTSGLSYAQTSPWSGVYGNEWIVAGQQYVKVTVSKEGIQRVPIAALPDAFKAANARDKIQLWHRGQMVALIKVDGSNVDENSAEILFYGVLNDGKSDELLYRPNASARANKLISLFSDKSAYFLTIGQEDGLRASRISQSSIPSVDKIESFHLRTDNVVYKDTSTHSTYEFPDPDYQNSFYEEGKSMTGPRLRSVNKALDNGGQIIIHYTGYHVTSNVRYNERFKVALQNLNTESGIKPKAEILVNGRSGNLVREIKIHIVRPDRSLIRTITSSSFRDFTFNKVQFELESTDIVDGEVNFGFESTQTHKDERFSVSYLSITYPQAFNINNKSYATFSLPGTSESYSRVQISNLPSGDFKMYDITDKNAIKIIDGSPLDFKAPRTSLQANILITSELQQPTFATAVMSSPGIDKDYLIISADDLETVSNKYASFRASTLSPKGQRFKPVVVKITDVYNQFNYGEPSPVAIRRFVDYMLSGANKDKFLLLIGKSTSYDERMVREMPNEVPTVGYPGSDELLVDGLGGVRQDVPAIPFGRIPAIDERQVEIYLDKVQEYEFGKINQDLSWRNNVLHVNGGDNKSQSESFRNHLIGLANANIDKPQDFVKSYVKGADASGVVRDNLVSGIRPLTLTQLQNTTGVGLITYYGHGTTWRTDNNIGYLTDGSKNYVNSDKYSAMLFFGCDVNNVFQNKNNTTINVSSARPLVIDWLFEPRRGAVIIFANSWDGYSTAFEPFMDILYPKIFVPDSQKRPFGTLLKEVADGIVPSGNSRIAADYEFYQANIHQGILLGDPAIKILNTTRNSPLPVQLVSFSGQKVGENKVKLNWSTSSEKNNSHFIVERSYNGKVFEVIGLVEGSGTSDSENFYSYTDNSPLSGLNYYRLKQVDESEDETKGAESYSRIISVKFDDTESIIVSPNPIFGKALVKLNVPTDIRAYRIIDSNGKVYNLKVEDNQLDLSSYPTGIYVLEVRTTNGDYYRKKIVKK